MADMQVRNDGVHYSCDRDNIDCWRSVWGSHSQSTHSAQIGDSSRPDGSQQTASADSDAQSTSYDDTVPATTQHPSFPLSAVSETTTSIYPSGTTFGSGSTSTALPDGANKSQPNADNPNSAQSTDVGKHGPPIRIILGAIMPLAIVIGFVVLAYICLRRHRQRKNQKQVLGQMEYHPTNEVFQSVYSAPLQAQHQPLPQVQPQPLSPNPPAAAPIVISSMAPAMGSAYFTGIDTSDTVSVVSNNVHSAGFGYDAEQGDEPPPPYRPRSVPPVSRETSVRQGEPSRHSQTQLIAPHGPGRTVSPFDDPDDDDAVSMISGMDGRFDRHQDDRMSDVSDMSYQDPTTTHQTV